MSGASVVAIGVMALSAPAFAQDAATAAAPKSDDTVVVVTGQRGQMRSAQKIKKDSAVIVDSVTAVDIGALPDQSVSEALQRISGLTLERTDNPRDPARLAVEGGNVEIRGLSWVRSETNGRDIFSAANGRGLSFDDISADLLSGVDVYKNPSASMIEGGIGGTVDLKTRLPFDAKKRVFAFSVDTDYGDLDKKPHTAINGFYSDRWHTGIGEIGVMVDLSSVDVGNRTDSLSLDKFNATSVSSGNTVTATDDGKVHNADGTDKIFYIPGSIGWRSVTWDAKRTGLAGALQWRPNESWLFTLNVLDARSRESNLEYALGSYDGSLTSPQPSWGYQYDSNNVLTAGTNPSAGYDADTRYELDHKSTADYSLNVKFTPNAKLTVTGDLQYVDSTSDMVSLTSYTELGNRPSISFSGLQSKLPTISVNSPNNTADEDSYYWAATMDHLEKNSGNQVSARIDAQYDFDDSSWLKHIKAGARVTDKHYVTRQTGWNWSLLSNQYWLGNPDTVYINQTGGSNAGDVQNAQLPKEVSFQTFKNFFNGAATVPGNVWFPSADLVSHGTAYAYNLLKGTETEGWGWTPLAANAWDSVHPESDNATAGVNRQQEKTAAAYVEASYGGSSLFGSDKAFDGNFGVRYVSTEAMADGAVYAFTAPTTACIAADCTLYNKIVAFSQGTINGAGAVDNKYNDILPSFNLRVHLTDEVQVRLGASRAMVRPDLSQMTAYTTLAVNQNADGTPNTNATGGAYTGTGGNPNLKPITADQFDLTVEDYFNPTGSITFDLFDKQLQNYIYTGTDAETYTANGQTFTFNVTRQFNGFKGSVKGFELAYQQFYDMLPGAWSGLGLQANYTHIDSNGGHNTAVNVFDSNQVTGQNTTSLPLEGMSPNSYNLAVMYEKYGISARLAYNWRSLYLLTTSGANINAPVWSEAYGQLDGSIFYTLNKQYKIGLQATNLTHARTILDASNPTNLSIRERYNWVDTDRRIAIVLRGTF
jgi:TonB-dependent receptor